MKTIIIILAIIVIGFLAFGFERAETPIEEPVVATTTEETPTNLPPEIDPAQNSHKDLIRVETPLPGASVSSPLTIRGEARGMWFFEATFPVVLTDWNGLIIAEGYAEAQDEWMTEEYVPFEATLTFDADTSVSSRGSLILQKSNASGLPEHDDAFEYVVTLVE